MPHRDYFALYDAKGDFTQIDAFGSTGASGDTFSLSVGTAVFAVSGGAGTVALEVSADGGTTWKLFEAITTTSTDAVTRVLTLARAGARYRHRCTAYSSGTLAVETAQNRQAWGKLA